MDVPVSLQIALKEWAVVCEALEAGRQVILLRKGGIYESAGEFELEHPRFLLFPTYLHQNAGMLKPEAAGHVQPAAQEPSQIRLSAMGVVSDIVQVQSRSQIDAIDDQHIWTGSLIDMRFNYRPENPLYLLLVRTYRLPQPEVIQNTPAYAGCKSWVPLDAPVQTRSARPVLDDAAWARRRSDILLRIGG